MAAPINELQAVRTVQQASLPLLQNIGVFTSPEIMNFKFKNWNEKYFSNQGDTISIEIPVRSISHPGLVVTNFNTTQQQIRNLTVGDTSNPDPQKWTARNVPIAYDAKQVIYNVRDFIDGWAASAVNELATIVQSSVAGAFETNTYRFYGDVTGGNVINSYGQLAQSIAKYDNYGAPTDQKRKVILPDVAIPSIIDQGLGQFAINRNNQDANTWQIASTMNADFYMSNMLPSHYAGTVGDDNIITTVTAISADGTLLTLSGAAVSDANAFKANDLIVLDFDNLTSGANTLLFQTYTGHLPSAQKPQVRVTADAASDAGGNVTVSIFPALIFDPTNTNQNANITASVVGVNVRTMPSHKCGAIISGDAFYLGMPRLPDESPFPTSSEYDPVTGCSIRLSKGSQWGGDLYGYIYDIIWGSLLVDEYAMRLIFPLTSTFF